MNEDRIWLLAARKLAGEASAAELSELEQLLQANPDLQVKLEAMSKIWEMKTVHEAKVPSAAKLWKQIDRKTQPPISLHKLKEQPSFFHKNLMLHTSIKTGWRNLVRGRAFSVINITGMAVGMAAAILILLWIQNELSFDRFHKKKDRIYAAFSRVEREGKTDAWYGTSMLLAPVLEASYPEVEATARINQVGAFVFHTDARHLESHGYITDPAFLKIFDFPLLQGDAATALSSTRSVVITESFARKLFGTEEAMGKMLRVDSNANFMVSGIVKDLPNNTRFDFEYLLPWSYMKEVHWDRPEWETAYIETSILLRPGISEATANDRFRDVVKRHSSGNLTEIFLHPISKWHLWSQFENGKLVAGGIKTVRLFGIIAAFILLIACINYMNLSTARSVKRAREVGVRKVAGAGRGSLIGQFLGESVLIALIAGIIALLIVQPVLQWFNTIIDRRLIIPYTDPWFWLSGAGFILFTGILAGSYPAFYLSSYKPIRVLKGGFISAGSLVTPRKVLVVLQFTFAITFIICSIVIYRQIRYGQDREIGYDQRNLVYMYIKGNAQSNYPVIRTELLNSGAITSITRTNSPVTDVWNGSDSYEWAGKKAGKGNFFNLYYTDKSFAGTMGLKIIKGRDIDAELYPADSSAILLNESAVKEMGFKDPIGQPVKSSEGNWHVVGVVNDFVTDAPFAPSRPTIIQGPGPHHWYGTMTVKLNATNKVSDNLARIGAVLKKYNPDYPFDYYFTDKTYAAKFEREKKTGTLAFVFAGLAIFISSLGLFAMAAYMAENRTKEIGIRKILGASVSSISTLLSKDFLKLVLISFVVASPVAAWLMHNWLQHYPYRISLSAWIFIVTGLLSVLLALVTVSFQAIKAALANPVKSLRTE